MIGALRWYPLENCICSRLEADEGYFRLFARSCMNWRRRCKARVDLSKPGIFLWYIYTPKNPSNDKHWGSAHEAVNFRCPDSVVITLGECCAYLHGWACYLEYPEWDPQLWNIWRLSTMRKTRWPSRHCITLNLPQSDWTGGRQALFLQHLGWLLVVVDSSCPGWLRTPMRVNPDLRCFSKESNTTA